MDADIESLKGVGPKKAEVLRKAGIRNLRDFFYNLPRDYDNYTAGAPIRDIRPGKVVVKGQISDLKSRRAKRRNLSIVEGVVRDETGVVRVVWFNQSYRMRQFEEGREYYFTGTYELKNGRYQLTSPQAALASDVAESHDGLVPVYVAHGAMKSSDFRRLVTAAKGMFASIPDLLPFARRGERAEALFAAHFPESMAAVGKAREYLAYEEVFELLLASKLNRRENEKLKGIPIKFEVDRVRKFVGDLPFKLTGSQRRAAWEIFQDMEKDTPMNRLLQGDVGAGKTMVAAMAAYEAVGGRREDVSGGEDSGAAAGGVQVALLAPTAILASQHYEGLSGLLGQYGIRTALLTGATKAKSELKQAIHKGEVDVVIGTHALLTDDTEFSRLGLVIIDEQHRFGVEQRQKLMLKSPKGLAPHLLSMTATPIPRSLQLTVFGDLDVSVLTELPAGRKPVVTQIITEVESKDVLYPAMREVMGRAPDTRKHGEKARGQQAYWICKAIDDMSGEGKSEVTSVKARAKRLSEVFPDKRVEFLHGKMKPAEKDAVMEDFASGAIDILVSTTVVEVGVDVPNATLMVIENAESYGLAQLHQLRGRVGRGASESYCYLLTSGDERPSRRLREIEKSNDGFHLAEVDLKLRGPGEIYGALQHGALDLRIATLSDTRLIARAGRDVERFLASGEDLTKYAELMAGIGKYQQITTLN